MGARSRLAELLSKAPAEAQAVEFEESWRSWGDIASVARGLGRVLDGASLGPGSRVGVVLENRPEHVAVVVALVASGRCVVTLSPLQPPERLAADIVRCGAPAVVASPEALERPGVLDAVTTAGLAVRLGRDGGVDAIAGTAADRGETAPGVTIEMLTSGTTGAPKRVRLTDAQFDAALDSSGQRPKEGVLLRSGVSLVSTPLVHIGGLWGAVSALYAGRRIALLPRFTLDPWVNAVERHRPLAAGLVPAAMRTVLDAGIEPERLSSLRVVTCGTTFCPPELADAFFRTYGARTLMTYGATEFAGAVAAWTLPLHEKWWETKAGSAGRPVPGVDMRVVDADGTALAPGEVGHLEVRTAQSPQGANAWTRTSDLGRVDEDGFVWIDGRADDAIIRGGFKVQPEQVRAALERHPAVLEAAVAALPDQRLGQVPVAAVELRAGHPAPDIADLIVGCREVLTPYEVPVHVVIVDELPRTPSSKVSRVELLDLVRASMAGAGSA
ncbi:fatty acid--CoA ligase family protein [Streptomyces sp. SID4956]|uniref:AMP-binding protein n=1 Tax=Streptomyces sp. SID4956 TaxID=2690290 RepID=UPI00136E1A03|nr:AMP-binding protein [Streptomyces sp. SID4956]